MGSSDCYIYVSRYRPTRGGIRNTGFELRFARRRNLFIIFDYEIIKL